MKKHWLGYTVFTLTCSAGVLIPMFVKAKKEAKENEETVKAIRDSLMLNWKKDPETDED